MDSILDPVDDRPKRSLRVRILNVGLWLGFAGLISGTILCLSAPWFWLGEVAVNFRWQLGLIAAVGTLCLLGGRAWRRALAALILALWAAGPEMSLAWGSVPHADGRTTLKVMSANVLWDNRRFDEVLALVAREDPDVLCVLESSRASCIAFDTALLDEYPHTAVSLDTEEWLAGTWAVKLYSKWALEEVHLLPFRDAGPQTRPAIEAVLRLEGEAVTLHVVHAPRAGKGWRNESRDRVLFGLAARKVEGHRVMVGDLNMTSSSPSFERLLTASGLHDSRKGFGRLPSWDASEHLRLPGLHLNSLDAVWIAIDHALVSDGLVVLDRRAETIPGSDHRAVIVELGIR